MRDSVWSATQGAAIIFSRDSRDVAVSSLGVDREWKDAIKRTICRYGTVKFTIRRTA